MNSRSKQIDQCLSEINSLFSSHPDSLVPIVMKAARLASLCDDVEHRFLFELHIDGVDKNEPARGRVQKWPDKTRRPKWDMIQAFFDDRFISDGQIQGSSLQQLEYMRNGIRRDIEMLNSKGRDKEALELYKTEAEIETILGRIYNRVGHFVRITETAQLQDQQITNKQLTNVSLSLDKRVFIGHGRSNIWKDLKDLISERLHLPYDEFNRQPTAGKSTKERLEELLSQASFAFLIMTAEDEHADQTLHARENVIHEIGLFQGRLGFSKAIVLLEEGCSEFSNIFGLIQIRFPKGDISARSEEIRRVLERENILTLHEAS